MLVLIKEGKSRTRKEASKRIAVHRNTIRDWLTRYESGGVDAIVQIKSPGAPSGQRSLPERVLGFLKERLAETTAMA
jgi:transposase